MTKSAIEKNQQDKLGQDRLKMPTAFYAKNRLKCLSIVSLAFYAEYISRQSQAEKFCKSGGGIHVFFNFMCALFCNYDLINEINLSTVTFRSFI